MEPFAPAPVRWKIAVSAGFSVVCPHCGDETTPRFAPVPGHACRACGEEFGPPIDDPAEPSSDEPFADEPIADEFADEPIADEFADQFGDDEPFNDEPVLEDVELERPAVKLRQYLIPLGFLCAFLVGLAYLKGAFGGDRAILQEAGRVALATPPGPPPVATAEQARRVGEAVAAAMAAGDRAALNELVDGDALVRLAFADLKLPAGESLTGVQRALDARDAVVDSLLPGPAGGQFRLLHVATRDGAPVATIRILQDDGGVGYVDLFPAPEGRVADIYAFRNGERASASMRQLIGLQFAGTDADRAGAQRLPEVTAALERGDALLALRLYEAMPEAMKAVRGLQNARADAVLQLGDEDRIAAALADLDRRFPHDPSLDLLRLDLIGDDREASATLTRVDAAVGGDPFLKGLLAVELPHLGRDAEALALGRAAVAAEPDLWEAQCGLLAGATATGRFDLAADALRRLRNDHCGVFTPDDLAEFLPNAAPLLASDAYAAFQRETPAP